MPLVTPGGIQSIFARFFAAGGRCEQQATWPAGGGRWNAEPEINRRFPVCGAYRYVYGSTYSYQGLYTCMYSSMREAEDPWFYSWHGFST